MMEMAVLSGRKESDTIGGGEDWDAKSLHTFLWALGVALVRFTVST
jgi:hypothetical protein